MQLTVAVHGAAEALDISERKLYQLWRNDPKFPKPITLGPRCNRWRMADLKAYVDAHPAVERAPEPGQLKKARETEE
jgi:predicted DNA-binding transcriptional regulator AlpA